MDVVFSSQWLDWKKTPETREGVTAKTDKTSFSPVAISQEAGGGVTDKTDKTPSVEQKTAKEPVGVTDKTDKTPNDGIPPCACCGGAVRWQDHGVSRCVACWPSPLTHKALAAERVYQQRRRRGPQSQMCEGAATEAITV
jgi:hypothetical protein